MTKDKHFDIETVSVDGRNIGYRVRSTHFYGVNQDMPVGWLIGRKLGARAIAFEAEIYKSRELAALALIENNI